MTLIENTKINILNTDNFYSDKIRWIGRTFVFDNEMCCYNCASGFIVRFFGKELKAVIHSAGELTPGIVILIDGQQNPNIKENIIYLTKENTKKEYTLFSSANEGYHTAKVLHITEPLTSSIAFSQISTDGYFEKAPDKAKYQFEVYGDSITAGYRNLRIEGPEDENEKLQNSCMTYIWLASEKFGAELSVFARTGVEILNSYESPCIVKNYWDLNYLSERDFLHNDKIVNPKWQFKNTVDCVFINLGTNDAWQENWDNNQVKNAIFNLCINLKKSYGENTKIVLLHGVMETDLTSEATKEAFEQLKNNNIKNVFIYELIQSEYGHPRIKDNLKNSEKMMNILNEIFHS